MKVIGITGGVGSGKSEVLKFLEQEYGAVVCQMDEVAKQIQKKGTQAFSRIVQEFGEQIVGADGELDRMKLGSCVFADEKKLQILNDIVHPEVLEWVQKDILKKTCQRTFQALRIDVNNEFEVLYEFMEKLPGALKPGGRAAILTFHSGEDKLVKKALKQGYKEGVYSEIANEVVRPYAEECAQNGRARSTKMRWAVRAGEGIKEAYCYWNGV